MIGKWNRRKQASQTEVRQIEYVELMIEESDATVAHPNAVVIYSHYTAIAIHTAVLRSWRHYLATRLTPGEFANLRHLAGIVLDLLFLLAAHFQKFNIVIILADHKHAWCLLIRHLNVTHHRTVEAF